MLSGFDPKNSCDLFNLVEFFIWQIIALIMLIMAIKGSDKNRKRLLLILAGTFVAFGFSDLVEISTDAWWSPWWLLLWKGLCIVIFLPCGYLLWLSDRQAKKIKLNNIANDESMQS